MKLKKKKHLIIFKIITICVYSKKKSDNREKYKKEHFTGRKTIANVLAYIGLVFFLWHTCFLQKWGHTCIVLEYTFFI